jgi:hypothetical protein
MKMNLLHSRALGVALLITTCAILTERISAANETPAARASIPPSTTPAATVDPTAPDEKDFVKMIHPKVPHLDANCTNCHPATKQFSVPVKSDTKKNFVFVDEHEIAAELPPATPRPDDPRNNNARPAKSVSSRAEQIFRETELKVAIRNYEATLTEIVDIEKVLADDGPTPSAEASPKKADSGLARVRKVTELIVPRVEFKNATVRETLAFLQDFAKKNDPAGEGLQFLNVPEKSGAEAPGTPASSAANDPNAKTNVLPPDVEPAPPAGGPDTRITLTLNNVPVIEVVKYVTNLANLKYRLEPAGISIRPLGASGEMYIKEWKVPARLFQAPKADPTAGGGAKANSQSARDFLGAQGISFPAGAFAMFSPVSSTLVVKNTEDQLDLVERVVEISGGAAGAEAASRRVVLEAKLKALRSWQRRMEDKIQTLTAAVPSTGPEDDRRLSDLKAQLDKMAVARDQAARAMDQAKAMQAQAAAQRDQAAAAEAKMAAMEKQLRDYQELANARVQQADKSNARYAGAEVARAEIEVAKTEVVIAENALQRVSALAAEKMASAEAVDGAKAQVARASAKLRVAEAKYHEAQELEKAGGAAARPAIPDPREAEIARAELDAAKVEVDLAQKTYQRAQALAASKAISQTEIDEAKANIERTTAKLRVAEARLNAASATGTMVIAGAVKRPGIHVWTNDMTVGKAIANQGGVDEAAGDAIKVVRKGDIFQYSRDAIQKDPASDPKVLPDDYIEVSPREGSSTPEEKNHAARNERSRKLLAEQIQNADQQAKLAREQQAAGLTTTEACIRAESELLKLRRELASLEGKRDEARKLVREQLNLMQEMEKTVRRQNEAGFATGADLLKVRQEILSLQRQEAELEDSTKVGR